MISTRQAQSSQDEDAPQEREVDGSLSQEEVADLLGLTKVQVDRIERQALQKLRDAARRAGLRP